MPSSLRTTGVRLPVEDSFYDLLIDTLDGLEPSARGPFLQRLLKSLTNLELTESLSLEYWDCTLDRRKELANVLGRPVSLKTALVDFLAGTNALRIPILMEYDDLKKLQINAATDPLTGLYNRRFFDEYFEKELNRAKRYENHLALITLDMHQFKEVNDRYGHPRGDQVLQLAATTLRSSMRTSDYAFRIGGDEFALLLPQSDREQAATLGRRVRSNFLAAIAPLGIETAVALDYGLAVHPEDGDQTEVLLHVADQRLYRMKNGGKEEPATPEELRQPAESEAPPSSEQARLTSHSHVSDPRDARNPDAQLPKSPETRASEPQKSPEGPPARPIERAITTVATAPPAPEYQNRRRAERVSLIETQAHAQFAYDGEKKLRVLDISSGGVALEAEASFSPQEIIHAVLHVPILPAVRVKLKPIYLQKTGDRVRVGCAFVA